MDADQNTTVWTRLLEGVTLNGLGLTTRDGRIDLSALHSPEPKEAETSRTSVADISRLSGLSVARRVAWNSLDFTGSHLKGLRFFDSTIRNCIFDGCDCRDWRLWGTQVEDCSFRSADLRNSALGGIKGNQRNTFHRVHFIASDLRGTAYVSASFTGCTFRDSRLDKVNFQGSVFEDCFFEGAMIEVSFSRHAFGREELPPNNMVRVDLTHADLRSVEFRNLDLNEASFPTNENHIVINEYPQTLDKVLQCLRNRNDTASRKLAAYLGVYRRWAGPMQQRGILNKNDLLEIGGDDGLQIVLSMIDSGAH